MRIRRSAAVALAVTFQRLSLGELDGFSAGQELVLQALRRSNSSLRTASDAELGEYVRELDQDQLRGVVSNVKGIYHELLVRRAENIDGDGTTAELFEALNHPGADLEFIVDGGPVRAVQLKAVQSPDAIAEHFARYPDIDVMATAEVFTTLGDAFSGRVTESGFENGAITRETEDVIALLGGAAGDVVRDGVVTSTLVAGALQARAVLSGRAIDAAALRSALETAGVGLATTVAMEALLGLV